MLGQLEILCLRKRISWDRFKITPRDQFIQALWPMTMIFGIGHNCVMHYLCVFCEYRRLRSRYTLLLESRNDARQSNCDHG